MIEVKGIIQPGDYVKAQYLHMRPRPLYEILGIIVLALFFWATWIAITDDDHDAFDLLYLALIIALILNYTVYIPWKTRRVYRQHKALQRELSFKFDATGALVTNENGQSRMPWSDYLRWKQNDHLILIYLSDSMYHMLPSRLFVDPDDFEKLGELLTSKIDKKMS
jgi:hypothetical protein